MPFSSLNDPNDLARACRVLDSAWAKIEELNLVRGDPEAERTAWLMLLLVCDSQAAARMSS
jgi:hypothetical protein